MNLYVSNISRSADKNELKELFAQIGEVTSVKIITDKLTGFSRGFGFVEMPNDADAEVAIKKLNNTIFFSLKLGVSPAWQKNVQTATVKMDINKD